MDRRADLCGQSLGESLEAYACERSQRLLLRRRDHRLGQQIVGDALGCMIIAVQLQSDLSSTRNVDMSGTHHNPSSGMTP
jgi:hypothetical protein